MEQQKPLTVALVREYWSKTYDPSGKPDWSHIFPFYSPDIVFQDSIQIVKGFDSFEAMCNRLTKRCKSLAMDLYSVIQEEQTIMMEWKMTMRFRIFPSSSIYGMTKLTLDEHGQIIHQRDYYDLWGDIYDNIPIFRRVYRWFMRVFFG